MRFIKDTVLIVWAMTTVCNYKCSYCPDNLHDGLYKFPTNTIDVINFLNDVKSKNKDKKIYIGILGGEPTLWPDFSSFLQILDDDIYVEIMTNGSRPQQWWIDNINVLDKIYQLVLTYHSEYADEFKFVELCKFLAKTSKNFVHVNVMIQPNEKFKHTINVFETLKQIENLSVKAKGIRKDFGDAYLKEYTEQQLKIIEASHVYNIINKEDIFNFDSPAFYKLSFDKKNTWKNQLCNIGLDSFFIKYNGLIYRGSCKVGGSIGTLKDYTLPTTGIICTKDWCPCVSDGIIKKIKINE